ncbi:hypothetical protein MWN34_01335 [Ancylobacter sp. 6x-1]|uniref:Uncharacterized protein n=1 Tax=Ancylobacter crimeensis TaxID=2579147 RepID=A0ABT0D6H6_9HYPH|nr:hypothetical protein [Ancylobacter crimeensis]MCK0195549.1 hypothetical protein [Ancylobacter crimeensis]
MAAAVEKVEGRPGASRRRSGCGSARRYAVSPRSPIESDDEVAAFFGERFGTKDMLSVLDECRAQFGAALTPSRTAAMPIGSG